MANILIVDDVRANRDILVTLLRHQGHHLRQAADGSEGYAAVQAEPPDLVITDVLMPVMDGYELVRKLRLDRATSAVPVIFYTAHYGEREAKALAHSMGVSYVLTKPAAPAEVLKIVARALAGDSPAAVSNAPLVATEFDRAHLRLLTDKLSKKSGDLRAANGRLRALINIGLELAAERDTERVFERVCVAARDLFGVASVTVGIIAHADGAPQAVETCAADGESLRAFGASDQEATTLAAVVAEERSRCAAEGCGNTSALRFPSRTSATPALLGAPITSPSAIYGWICLVGEDGRRFTDDDEDLLMALAGQVGRVYENVDLYRVAQKRGDELEHQICERQEAQAAADHERSLTQRYLDAAEVILLGLDAKGRITLANRYACAVLGWTEDELLGRDFIETCIPPAIRESTRVKLGHVHAGLVHSVIENAILTRSGEERMIEWRNTLLRDAEGRVVGTLSSGADITEQVRVVAALQTAEERTRFALEAASVGTWDMNYRTGALEWSDLLERQYGWAPGAFDGTLDSFLARVHPDDRQSLVDTIERAVHSGSDFTTKHRSVWPDGTVRWLSGAGRILLGDEGQPVRGVGISIDVTEHRALEEQYQQAQKMEAVGRLAGGVAHDFNNLLTAILGYCELLLADIDPADPRSADVGEIQKAGLTAAGVTRQLLAFSRRELIQPQELDLNAVVSEMHGMLTRLIGEDVTVTLALRHDIAAILADRSQVEQIVMNLAVNARDAMPTGGTLTIETASVTLDADYARMHIAARPGRHVMLTVSDTGTGMSAEVQARLFEPFFTTKEPGKGTGLGLATVHGIVARSGGSVNVYSEVGKGTSVKVYFPETGTQRVASRYPTPISTRRVGTETVLVVEDAEGLRELASRLLERQGYVVLVAANADEAIELFERHASIDVLLTDVVMPGASGPELTRQLVDQRPDLKVIYMSGYTDEAIAHHGVLSPGVNLLQKPFTGDTLGRKVREVLDS